MTKNRKIGSKSEKGVGVVVKLTNVSKKYFIHHEKPTLAERIFKGKGEEFYALKSINLEIDKGERVGIIGTNGSGKTTLLKIISGIATPTKGKVKNNGTVVSLIDLEAGFHPDLTGIQNVYLNGTILGMKSSEIDKLLNKIIKFASIGSFIDAPLFTYSSGMKLRLGFAVAVHTNPDILLVDEALGVGDEKFQLKCKKKMFDLNQHGTTVIIVSHWLEYLRSLCTRICVMDKGKIKEDYKVNRN